MKSSLGYIVDIRDVAALADEELAGALSEVEMDCAEAEGWELDYANEVKRLRALWDVLEEESDKRGAQHG